MPKITDKKTGKVRKFKYTAKGRAAYTRALRSKIDEIMASQGTVGPVQALDIRRRIERGPTTMSKRRLSPVSQRGTIRTPAEIAAVNLKNKQDAQAGTGFRGTTTTSRNVARRSGITPAV